MRYLAAIAAVALLVGCASSRPDGFGNVGRSRPDNFWYANTNPQGAVITTSNGFTCVTPCRLEIPRGGPSVSTFTYVIEKAGYETVAGEARIQTNDTLGAGILLSLAATAAGSPIIPGPLDNNGYREIEPNPLNVDLVPVAVQQETPRP